MGYTTEFRGQFNLNKQLGNKMEAFLKLFNETRRMGRNQDPAFGVDGEFFVFGSGAFGQGSDADVRNHNQEPSTQPGLWCQWTPTEDGLGIEWDNGEKFYSYTEWLVYLINKILAPNGYILNGSVDYRGEGFGDDGTIEVVDNEVYLNNSLQKVPDSIRPDVVLILVEDGKQLGENTLLLGDGETVVENRFSVKIEGSGTNEEIATRLEEIAKKIRRTDHEESVKYNDEAEWEDDVLFTSIKKSDV